MSVPSTAITNVRVFDGHQLTEPRTVAVEGGMISPTLSPSSAETIIDGQGGALLPGLIDSHVHLRGPDDLAKAIQYGVTLLRCWTWPAFRANLTHYVASQLFPMFVAQVFQRLDRVAYRRPAWAFRCQVT